MDTVKKYWAYIAAAIGGLLLFFTWEAKKSAEALLENQETKEKLLDKDKEINKHQAIIDAEAEKRKAIQAIADSEKRMVTNEELVNFFNDPTRKP